MALLVVARRRPMYFRYQAAMERYRLALPAAIAGWAMTMLFVSVVSAVGTAPDLPTGLAYLDALFWGPR